ncbi:MAG: hypothetical protein OTI34_15075 [Lewinella sp.]|nr:hypothetical protein [Lewinella sp.]
MQNKLGNDEATKNNIIASCREHFSKAGPEGSVIGYAKLAAKARTAALFSTAATLEKIPGVR